MARAWSSVESPLRLAHMVVDADPEGALAYLDEAARLGAPAGDLNSLRIRAWLRAGRKSEALRRLKKTFLRGEPSAARFLKAAEISVQAGAFAAAEALLRKALRLAPDAPEPRVRLGRCLLWRGASASALKLSEEALALDSGMIPALLLRGAARARLGRFAEADADLSRAIARSSSVEAFVWRAETRRRLGRMPEAISDADAALATQGQSTAASCVRALAILDGGADEDAWRLAYYLALSNATQLGLWPRDHKPRPARAVARRQLEALLKTLGGNFTENSTRLRRRAGRAALALCVHPPASVRERAAAAQALLPLRGPEAVLEALVRLQKLFPDSHVPFLYSGEFLLWLGRFEEGKRDFERALEVRPTGDYANFGIALALTLLGRPAEAVGFCGKVRQASLQSYPAQANLSSYRGEARLRAGQAREAAADLTRAVKLNARKLSTWFLLALALDELAAKEAGRVFAALEAWTPELLADAAAELAPGAREDRRAILEQAVRMMKGNRSSWLPFYASADGKLAYVERLPPAEMDGLARALPDRRA